MKFKIDENLPVEFAELLRPAHHDAATVVAQGLTGAQDPGLIAACQQEGRVLVTLDQDFANIRAYPPQDYPGLMILRVRRQDKEYLIDVFRRAIPLIAHEPLEHRLWIVEEARVRIHGEESD